MEGSDVSKKYCWYGMDVQGRVYGKIAWQCAEVVRMAMLCVSGGVLEAKSSKDSKSSDPGPRVTAMSGAGISAHVAAESTDVGPRPWHEAP
jgi:hypothetical protein